MKGDSDKIGNILQRVDPLQGSDLETNNETTSALNEQILNKEIYAAVAA
jgi:hypothetical protein